MQTQSKRFKIVASRTNGFQNTEQKSSLSKDAAIKQFQVYSKVNEVQKEIAIFDAKNERLCKEKLELEKEIKRVEKKILDVRKQYMNRERSEINQYNR